MRTVRFGCGLAFLLAASRTLVAGESDAIDERLKTALQHPILSAGTPLREVRAYVAARIPRFSPPTSAAEWASQAAALRRRMLEEVIYRGEAATWRDAKSNVQWFDEIQGGADYVIRKFRYEALPGMWIPALLYEPQRLEPKAPVFINLNGHDRLGKATPETQRRCINLARRGMLVYLPEFIYFGQLDDRGNRHNRLVQLDLCGTSGIAPFLLAVTRVLDIALANPHADTARVGVAGLSGGGWQTIMLASLDERIKLANPVAGYSSMLTRTQASRDVGDCEQIPADLCTIADYTHLTAMVAPRPLLLSYNAKDDCCFLPAGALPPLEAAAGPVYELCDAAMRFRTHINHDPGTHNFERENREMLYRLIGDSFFSGETGFNRSEIDVAEAELKTADELAVPMPAENATLQSLAVALSGSLPRSDGKNADPSVARSRLSTIIRLPRYDAHAKLIDGSRRNGTRIDLWQLRMGDEWTVPVVEFVPADARKRTIIVSDAGRGGSLAVVRRCVASGERVLAIDLIGFGEAVEGVEPTELHMIATVGGRLLGVQAAQLLASADWFAGDSAETTLVALGPRSSLIALVAAAMEPESFTAIDLRDAWPSLKEFIHQKLELEDAPELACFGLLKDFDIPQIESLATPRRVDRTSGELP